MIIFLSIVGYVLGMLASAVFQKCAGLWKDYTPEINIMAIAFWPIAMVLLILWGFVYQLLRLADLIVKKVCPNVQ